MTLARDVAKELDKRQRRRKLLFLGVVAALIVLAVMYLQCGSGFGFGGGGKGVGGKGKGTATANTVDAGPTRCALRVDAKGISLDGKPATQDAAVTACKAAGGAEVVVVPDATQGVWDALKAALETAKVPTFERSK